MSCPAHKSKKKLTMLAILFYIFFLFINIYYIKFLNIFIIAKIENMLNISPLYGDYKTSIQIYSSSFHHWILSISEAMCWAYFHYNNICCKYICHITNYGINSSKCISKQALSLKSFVSVLYERRL